jgi:malate dehydrogenase (oxaloacetate-decarboxylating)
MANLTPNSSFSLLLRLKIPNRTGMLAKITQAIAESGGNMGDVGLVSRNRKFLVRTVTVDASSTEHAQQIVEAVRALSDIEVLEISDRTFQIHEGGKISVESKLPLDSQDDLAMAYTPGVGRICMEIAHNPERVYDLTIKGNTIAIVTDGSAVLGLGNLGPEGAMPVMEGKALLFKKFAGLDAFPVCLATQDADEIVETVKRLAPVFGGVNLEDISAPRCFAIEERLRKELDIPVFHDDQHGTAIVTLAALVNALKLVKKSLETIKVVINGAGAAGVAIARLLQKAGVKQILMCDSKGILSHSRDDLNAQKQEFAVDIAGSLADAMQAADVFLGVSVPGVVTRRDGGLHGPRARSSSPWPTRSPKFSRSWCTDIVAVMATGRSDYPNQINNVLAFPGVLRGALDCRAQAITTSMYLEAAFAIASLVSPHATHPKNTSSPPSSTNESPPPLPPP